MARSTKMKPKTRTPSRATSLDRLSYRELLDLQSKISSLIETRRNEERAELTRKLAVMAASSGFSLPELVGGRRATTARRTTMVVRYRHPKNPELTWTGRGRRPKWLAKAGRNIERYRIA